jgi:2-dehydro-3-deoxygluconokinase
VELVMARPRIVVVGEGMIELSRSGGDWRLGHGGDTLNSAIHLARSGFDVAYLTALGADPFSEEMRTAWRGERLDTRLVLTDPERQPGLYAVRNDSHGERSFFYWREHAAARRMFELAGTEEAQARAAEADILLFSLISLAIIPENGRRRLFDLARSVRANGGRVAFDSNYRARLWADGSAAREARDEAAGVTDIGLPTLADETLLGGGSSAEEVVRHWTSLGTSELVVKLGAQGCIVGGGIVIPPPTALDPVDTSGAGDAFNAGYLAARLGGADAESAVLAGHRLAGWVIMHPGAIPARTRDAPYAT